MMERPVFYRDRLGHFLVTDTVLRTPRKTFRLAQVELVSVQRPLLLFAGLPASGIIGFTLGFWRYLEPVEYTLLLAGSAAAIIMAACFGTLRIHSLALRDDELSVNYATIWRLRAVRHAVEQALIWREHRENGQ